ncbi:MAG: hypothetical protein U1E77_18995 [Inhella sp.]
MLRFFVFGALMLAPLICAGAPTASERREFLEAIRPEAERHARQKVLFKVKHLNFDGGWAVLVGSVVEQAGRSINWERTRDCDPNLDKMLWVVAKRSGHSWRVLDMTICATEPPYWYIYDHIGLRWPCGVYAGLEVDGSGIDLRQRCLRDRRPRFLNGRPRPRIE